MPEAKRGLGFNSTKQTVDLLYHSYLEGDQNQNQTIFGTDSDCETGPHHRGSEILEQWHLQNLVTKMT
jgi:hypothetical protein